MHTMVHKASSNRLTGQHHMDLELIREEQFQSNC
jgi:hypothetical protein